MKTQISIMKKSLLFLLLIAITTLTSCRITKTVTMLNTKSTATNTMDEFLKGKAERVSFLDFSDLQKEQALAIWENEKQQLESIDISKNSEIAPVIYKSENDFRSILTDEQLKEYRETIRNTLSPYLLNDRQLIEIKRIYKL